MKIYVEYLLRTERASIRTLNFVSRFFVGGLDQETACSDLNCLATSLYRQSPIYRRGVCGHEVGWAADKRVVGQQGSLISVH